MGRVGWSSIVLAFVVMWIIPVAGAVIASFTAVAIAIRVERHLLGGAGAVSDPPCPTGA